MAVSGHLQLILLMPVLSLCGATEYYVRPTEPTNTSCPAQPCLTLNQYVSDSDNYFKSNTVFKFLPGTHHMDRPVIIGNVHNVSLESFSEERPYLVTQFSCKTKDPECSAAVQLRDVHNVSLKSITVTIQTPNVSGIIFVNVSHVNVYLTTTNSSNDNDCTGIATYGANSVNIQSSSAINCTFGLTLHSTNNSYINNVTAAYNLWGVVLDTATNTCITNTVATNNKRNGMMLISTNNIQMINTSVTCNRFFGMQILHMNNSTIINTTVAHNYGCGMKLFFMSNTNIINTTTVLNSVDGMCLGGTNNINLINTTAAVNGVYGMFLYYMNNTNIISTNTTHNGGPGILLHSMRNTLITNVTISLNGWNDYDGFNEQVTIFLSTSTLIHNSSFTDINTARAITTGDPGSLPAVFGLYQSTLHISRCNFTGNHISAIRGEASNITLSGNLVFSSNRAFFGTAFILVQDSILNLTEKSHISFLNNHALITGGVFYIVTNIKYIFRPKSGLSKSTTCFLDTESSRFETMFVFVNNSAGMGGDILFGGEVGLGLDGQWNCLDSFKRISNISQNSLSLISSDPSRVCLCNGTGQPDCMILDDPTPLSIYPGQSIIISAVVVGQDFGTVAGSVYAQFLPMPPPERPPQLESWQRVQLITQRNCNNLSYSIFPQSEVLKAVLILTAHDSHVPQYKFSDIDLNLWKNRYKTSDIEPIVHHDSPVYVNISFLPCPPGFMLTTDPKLKHHLCDCDHLLQQIHGVQCHIQDQTIGRSGLLWVGMISDSETNGTTAASPYCPLDYCKKIESNVTLREFDSQCNFNHSGTLCGGCQAGLSLALGSAQCLPCSNKYLAMLIPFTLAGPVLVAVIKLLDLTISQGTLNGLIFYANIIKVNEYVFLPQGQTNPLTLFLAWLSLDFGVETCFFHGLSAYSKTWLQFVFPLYIWSIAGLIIILAKYSDRVAKVMGNNSVPVLATLFLLSYAKIFRTIITALSYTIVYTSHGHKAVWTADGNVNYLGPKHAPLFVVAVGTLLFLWLPYTLLLFLGQWLHMCNCRPISHLLMLIKPFLDAHYGPLKGKHRYWFGALLLVRAVILLIKALVPADHTSTIVFCISVFAIILTHYGQFVYHNLAVSAFDSVFFMNLALLSGTSLFIKAVGEDPTLAAYILIGIAFVQFIGLVLFKVFFILKHNEMVVACLRKGRPAEEDWEEYEQAVLHREVESIAEEQDIEYWNTESLPTY